MNVTHILRPVLFAVIALVLTSVSTASNAQAEWTILVYMNADNNLEPDAFTNFNQMVKVGSTPQVNVVVQFDRIAKYYHTTPDWSQTLRFLIKKDTQPLPKSALQDMGELNMGDGAVLADFVQWGKKTFPAKKYMLVIWDHGQGWRLFAANLAQRKRSIELSRALPLDLNATSLKAASVLLRNADGQASPEGQTAPFRSAPGSSYRSASNDETNNDVLYNREIADSLKAVLGQEKLDVIGFDACLMAMVESAYAFRDIGKYMVASEELEPGAGWNYEAWLSALVANPTQDAKTLAVATVAAYAAAYPDGTGDGPDTTMSALDLSMTDGLSNALSQLSESLITKLNQELQSVIEARSAVSTYAPGYSFYHVDLQQFLTELRKRTKDSEVRVKIDAVLAAISSSVIAHHAGADRMGNYGSNGIAIYFPASQHQYVGDPYSEGGYEKGNTYYPVQFVQNFKWTDFLHAYWSRVP